MTARTAPSYVPSLPVGAATYLVQITIYRSLTDAASHVQPEAVRPY